MAETGVFGHNLLPAGPLGSVLRRGCCFVMLTLHCCEPFSLWGVDTGHCCQLVALCAVPCRAVLCCAVLCWAVLCRAVPCRV